MMEQLQMRTQDHKMKFVNCFLSYDKQMKTKLKQVTNIYFSNENIHECMFNVIKGLAV